MPLMSQRAYAKHRGCTPKAVRKALASGRISLTGERIDSEQADADWLANTNPMARMRDHASQHAAGGPLRDDSASKAYAAARAAREEIRREREQMDLDKEKGRLVDVDDITQRYAKFVLTSRNQLLGIPARAKGELPHLSRRDLVTIDRLIREALTELADRGGSVESDSPSTEGQE